jgi:hypothetical protein
VTSAASYVGTALDKTDGGRRKMAAQKGRLMKKLVIAAVLSLLVAASGAWAQGKSGGAPGGGAPGVGGGSPFPSPTPAPSPAPMPITPSTPIGGAPGGSSFGTPSVATDPLSAPTTPLAPGAGSAPPVDRFRELHGHAHAHLCKDKGCEQYCEGRERSAGADKRPTFVRQCRAYCMEKC